jgi:rhamnulokinase
MTDPVLVAFDLGAESGRAIIGRYDGERLRLDEAHRFQTRAVRLPDGLYWDALGLYAEICAALAELARGGANVRSVGIDSWGCDFGLIDRDGVLIGNPLNHRDGRGAQAMETAFARVSAEEIYETTGVQFLPFNTLFQLVALEQSTSLRAAESALLIPDLLGYWLSGRRLAETTNASTTQLLDAHTGGWALDMISRLGIEGRLLPELIAPGEVVGGLLPHVAEATRLPAATAVIAVASHDTASAVVAVPFGPGTRAAYISSGTWSLVGVEVETPVVTERARAANLTNERGFGATIRLLKNVMGLWLVQECRRAWVSRGAAPTYTDMAELARKAPSGGPLFDPDSPALLAPGDMPARIRSVCEQCGQPAPDERAVLIRAVFESLACKYRLVLEQLECATGSAVEVVHVIGGGVNNAFLCQLTANVARRPVLAGPTEAAALGNIVVQLHAFDELDSLAEMRELVRRSIEVRVYEPDADVSRWEALYDRFRRVASPDLVGGGVAR